MCRIKYAGPVCEPTLRTSQFNNFFGLPIQRTHRNQRVCGFLPVRTDVLNRSSSNGSWNAAEALDSGEIRFDTRCDDAVPVLPCGCREKNVVSRRLQRNAPYRDSQHHPGKSEI